MRRDAVAEPKGHRAELRGGVVAEAGHAQQASHGGDGDDAAVAAREHAGQQRLRPRVVRGAMGTPRYLDSSSEILRRKYTGAARGDGINGHALARLGRPEVGLE